MICPISKQTAQHANIDEAICPECDCYIEEKHNVYGHWLECVNPACDFSTDIDEGED